MTNFIWVTTQKALFHSYPNAPEPVSFLRNEHRHLFHFKIYVEVFTDDRDIEFIMFKRFIEQVIDYKNMGSMSCEMIADKLFESISMQYKNRHIKIEVSEDGENGVLMDYPVKKDEE
jgi:hypothetical protein